MNAPRTLAAAGLWGAVLTFVILSMSVLLRLGTQVEAGEAVSTLGPGIEQWARIAHRVAAMGVGILAALALVAASRLPPAQRPGVPVGIVVALTLLLALIGRYTPGYRTDLVTVLNVAGGIGLIAAFWALRALPAPRERLAAVALGVLLALAALGAAADAAAMRGAPAWIPLHLGLAAIFAGLALVAAWRQRARRVAATTLAVLTMSQLALGMYLVTTPDSRALAPSWLHAMIACALAILLASLAFGGRHRR